MLIYCNSIISFPEKLFRANILDYSTRFREEHTALRFSLFLYLNCDTLRLQIRVQLKKSCLQQPIGYSQGTYSSCWTNEALWL